MSVPPLSSQLSSLSMQQAARYTSLVSGNVSCVSQCVHMCGLGITKGKVAFLFCLSHCPVSHTLYPTLSSPQP